MEIGNRAIWDVKYFCAAKATVASGAITYADGQQIWDTIRVSFTPNVISAAHTSETGGRKTRYKVLGGDLSIDHEPEAFETRALLFGHSVDAETGVISDNINDLPQHVGAGFYMAMNNDTWQAVFFPYAIFSEGTEQADGALDGVTYNTKTTTGSAEADPDGNYYKAKSFNSETEAKAWVNTMLGMN